MEQFEGYSAPTGAGKLERGNGVGQLKWNSRRAAAAASGETRGRVDRLPPPCGKNAERWPCEFLEPSTPEICDRPRRYTVADRPAASTPRAGMIGVKNKAT